jgi:urease accessory protein
MPETALGAAFGLGFLTGTALLHAAGIGLGALVGRIGERRAPDLLRATGAAAAIAGMVIFAGHV